MKDKRRIVFFDIDNTLWDSRLRIPESTRRAVRLLRENGHLAFINSGRSRGYIRDDDLFSIGFDGVVSSCGEMIECTPACFERGESLSAESGTEERKMQDITTEVNWDRVAFSYEMSAEDVARCVSTVRKYRMRPILEGKEYLYFDDEEFGNDPYGQFVRRSMGNALKGVNDNWGKWEVSKLSCAMDDPDMIRPCFDELADLLTYLVHNQEVVEMVPHGFSKGTGIRKVCELTGIPVEHTVAFGDSVNDLEMLRAAGVGVAMGNGTEKAKEAADYVTTGIHEDGIWNALKGLGLI